MKLQKGIEKEINLSKIKDAEKVRVKVIHIKTVIRNR